MFYTPGPKAFAEYVAFTNRQLPQSKLPESPSAKAGQGRPVQATLALTSWDPTILTELTSRGIAEAKARDLLANLKPGEEVMDQLEYVDTLIAKDRRGKVENPPGLYVFYVRDNVSPPADFRSSRKTKLHEQAQQMKNAELARRRSWRFNMMTTGLARWIDLLPRCHRMSINRCSTSSAASAGQYSN